MKLVAHNISKILGNKFAIKDLEFSVETPRLLILGHNGSGKTTLLSLISGLLKPDSGNIMLDGIEPYRDRKNISKHLAFSFGKISFPYHMSVSSYCRFLQKTRNKEKVSEMVDLLGISDFENANISGLSTGQEQLLYLLSTLTSNQDVLILDEPFAHLDPARYVKLAKVISTTNKDIIITTQNLEEAEHLGETFIVLNEGELVWTGSRQNLYDNSLFEVYLNGTAVPGLKVVYEMANVLIVENDLQYLKELVDDGKILGFKRAGLRRLYGEVSKFS